MSRRTKAETASAPHLRPAWAETHKIFVTPHTNFGDRTIPATDRPISRPACTAQAKKKRSKTGHSPRAAGGPAVSDRIFNRFTILSIHHPGSPARHPSAGRNAAARIMKSNFRDFTAAML
jgi:hypothetical protein